MNGFGQLEKAPNGSYFHLGGVRNEDTASSFTERKTKNPGHCTLAAAAKENNVHLVDELLGRGVNVDERDGDGFTALYWACCRGHVTVCQRLLGWRCDVNAKGKAGASALMACADNGHLSCVRMLLQHKNLQLNAQNERGDSALHLAAYRGHVDIVTTLSWAGAETNLRNVYNHTALAEAFIRDNTQCVQFLRTVSSGQTLLERRRHNSNHGENKQKCGVYSENCNASDMPDTKGSVDEPRTPSKSSGSIPVSPEDKGREDLLAPGGCQNSPRLPECRDERQYESVFDARNVGDTRHQLQRFKTVAGTDTEIKYKTRSLSPRLKSMASGVDNDTVSMNSFLGRHQECLDSDLGLPSYCDDSLIDNSISTCNDKIAYRYFSTELVLTDSKFEYRASRSKIVPSTNVTNSLESKNPKKSMSNSGCTFLSPNVEVYERCYQKDSDCVRCESTGHVCENHKVINNYCETKRIINSASKNSSLICPPKEHPSHRKSEENIGRNSHSSGDDNNEIIGDLKTASYLENLQMRVLMLEESLKQERQSKDEMRKEIIKLKEENTRLKNCPNNNNAF